MKLLLSYSDFLVEKAHQDLNEWRDSQLVMEGGAAGHMSHPFDDKSLTFGDFKKLIEAVLKENLTSKKKQLKRRMVKTYLQPSRMER